MVFVADDLGAWLVGLLADAGRRKLTTFVLGTDQERALRSAVAAAVRLTAQQLRPDDDGQSEHLTQVISQVFSPSVSSGPLARCETVLEELQASITRQLAVLDNANLTGAGQSSADVLQIPTSVIVAELTGNLLREIVSRGARGGPLEPLAIQLSNDKVYLQGLRVEGKIDRLDDKVLEVLARLSGLPAVGAGYPARLLLEVEGLPDRDSELTISATHSPLYVRRSEFHDEFSRLVGDGSRLIVLAGLPGMGKTWLAKALTNGSPLIRVVNGLIESGSVQAALNSYGFGNLQFVTGEVHERLAVLLSSERGPRYVVLDGLDSADEISTLIPYNTRSIVVVTCRDRGRVPPDNAAFIGLSRMGVDEAIEMVNRRLPELAEAEVNQLVKTLDYYPLAIQYACGLIGRQHISVERFCRDASSGVDESAKRIRTSDGAMLLTVLKQIVSTIRATDPLAGMLLELVAYCEDGSTVSRHVMWRWAAARTRHIRHGELSPTRFAQALDVLEQFAVIEDIGKPVRRRTFDSGWVRIHAWTAQLVREKLARSAAKEVILSLVAVNREYYAEGIQQKIRDAFDRARASNPDLPDEELTPYILLADDNQSLTMAEAREKEELSDFSISIFEYIDMHRQTVLLCGRLIIDGEFYGLSRSLSIRERNEIVHFLMHAVLFVSQGIQNKVLLPEHWIAWAKELAQSK